MKKFLIIINITLLFLLPSCKTEVPRLTKVGEQKISKTVKVDNSEYIDCTNDNINASVITNSDFLLYCRGSFRNGNNVISINPEEETITIETSSSLNEKMFGKNVKATFKYDIDSASSNLLYIRPKTRESGQVFIDDVPYSILELPSFLLYIPLYGFGQKRIEVSPILDGEVLLSSGTYWKECN